MAYQKNSKTRWVRLISGLIRRGVGYLVKSSMGSIPLSVINTKKYIWYLKCIKEGFKTRGIVEPDFKSKNWGVLNVFLGRDLTLFR